MMKTYQPEKSLADEHPQLIRSMRRYFVVGLIATGVDWVLFSILTFGLEWNYLLSGAVSFVVATFAGYLSALRLVFRGGRHKRWIEVALIYLASALGLAVHLGVMLLLAGWLGLNVFLAKVAATAATFLWNFATRYYWIFDRYDANS